LQFHICIMICYAESQILNQFRHSWTKSTSLAASFVSSVHGRAKNRNIILRI
jgi:hypothetical protein